MITEIGIVAGDIWHYLERKQNATLDEIENGIGKPRDLLLMSLGWLAREGHVLLRLTPAGYVISLNQGR